ncbi:MAG: glutaredoxin 3 [Deltaproteobacteria bacterium]|nr:glutaredoxin 3 [Deltaproteobacteria bacterium]
MKKVTLYTTHYCGYCRRAKSFLKDKGIPFTEIDVEQDDAKRNWLKKTTGQSTVPQIFIGEESIGGYEELAELDRSGALLQKIK